MANRSWPFEAGFPSPSLHRCRSVTLPTGGLSLAVSVEHGDPRLPLQRIQDCPCTVRCGPRPGGGAGASHIISHYTTHHHPSHQVITHNMTRYGATDAGPSSLQPWGGQTAPLKSKKQQRGCCRLSTPHGAMCTPQVTYAHLECVRPRAAPSVSPGRVRDILLVSLIPSSHHMQPQWAVPPLRVAPRVILPVIFQSQAGSPLLFQTVSMSPCRCT